MNIIILVVSAIIIIAIAYLLFRKPKVSSDGDDNHLSQVYVGNLLYSITEDDLTDFFSEFGKVTAVRVIRDMRTRRSKGFAFVTFANPSQAKKALVSHGEDFNGRSIVVRIAREK